MSKTKVLLVERVERLGAEGDTPDVSLGYFRNFLGPKGLAVPITHANKKRMEALLARRKAREIKEKADAEAIQVDLEKQSVVISVKTGPNGKLFGAVTSLMVSEKLTESGFNAANLKLNLPKPVKELGQHEATVKLHPEVTAKVKFEVVSENPIESNENE